MSRRTDNEQLLGDVMAGESDAAFHEALLGETLRLARRRRFFRRSRRAVAVVAVLVGLVVLIWQTFSPGFVSPKADTASYRVIHSEPLPAASLVRTKPLAGELLVASIITANIIETSTTRRLFREISDDELLAMVAPKVAALVRLGPHKAELVVLESPVEETSPPN